jgi:adenosine 3'-phospho 5'-phosphosulfate transporter B2
MDVLKTPAGRQGLRLAFFVSGIVCSLLVYGVLQERIMTQVRLTRCLSTRCGAAAACACALPGAWVVAAPLRRAAVAGEAHRPRQLPAVPRREPALCDAPHHGACTAARRSAPAFGCALPVPPLLRRAAAAISALLRCGRALTAARPASLLSQPYGDEEEHFKYSVFLVLNNRLVSMSIAACVLAWKRLGVAPVAPLPAYAAVSLSNVIATTCQYEALRYVSFPVQTLGKCGKMIPVMIWGRIIMGRRYGPSDYAVAAAVTAGATIFLLGGEVTSSASKHHGKSAGETSVYGLMLMGGYLGFDGFTSTFQDKLFKGYAMETYNQMLWVTACSACLSAAWLLGDSTMGDALAFVSRHPEALRGIFALSLSSAIGQLFILNTIREFGALTFATVMTSRQFLSILLSCVLFMHPLTGAQWLGTASIFGALYYQAFVKSKSHSKKGGAASEGAAEMPPVKAADEGPILPLTTRDAGPGDAGAGGSGFK